ncbi:hypothetical protein SLEP1_g24275 [Rubroshorea leprosula]|uniref:30S ribosomal protein S17 n=1 Tax=Rubroshorea leprosula TaxID=152421 RepID=A0AAV5JLE2_9ROSI|nr:hypothetical protein SLEP1_g24275 [Rubroshorea leprosula]
METPESTRKETSNKKSKAVVVRKAEVIIPAFYQVK